MDAEKIVTRNHTLIGLSWGSTYPVREHARVLDAHEQIQKHMRAKRLNPLIHAVAAFDDASQLLQALAEGKTVGKAVVQIR
ncbi:MAG: hypothetical protein RQ826_05105 [Xanthomonadales bacterium]|nr:hypothetical protein [Xanthomonadales bacterium]